MRNQKGFTLIELLVVVIIIGILAAVAIPKLMSNIENSKIGRAKADIAAYNSAIATYQAESDDQSYPTALSALHPTYMGGSSVRTDPWGTAYSYTSDGTKYTLQSTGNSGDNVRYTSDDGILTTY